MGANSKIGWTDHTFNPWIGCSKVSAGCANCYAEREFGRKPRWANCWGPGKERLRTSDANWKLPLKWDREAAEAGVRRRVFCGSLCDVFEDREDLEVMQMRVLCLTINTPHLDWLFLTKRPASAKKIMNDFYICVARLAKERSGGKIDHVPDTWLEINAAKITHHKCPNVWIGVSVEDQATADERIPALLSIPAALHFFSAEPLLGPLIIDQYLGDNYSSLHGGFGPGLKWGICGGESGPQARPMHPDWARGLRDQCQGAGVPFYFKQWGEWAQVYDRDIDDPDWGRCDVIKRETPNGRWMSITGGHGFHNDRVIRVDRVGKKAAGRLLDGRTWDEVPGTVKGLVMMEKEPEIATGEVG